MKRKFLNESLCVLRSVTVLSQKQKSLMGLSSISDDTFRDQQAAHLGEFRITLL